MIGLFALGRLLLCTRTGLLAMLFYILSPLSILHDRMALFDTPMVAFCIWSMVFSIRLFRDGNRSWGNSVLLSATVLGAFIMKAPGLQAALFVGFSCLIYQDYREWKQSIMRVVVILVPVLVSIIATVLLVKILGLRRHSFHDYPPYVMHLRDLYPLRFVLINRRRIPVCPISIDGNMLVAGPLPPAFLI